MGADEHCLLGACGRDVLVAVTVLVEVPMVKEMVTWTVATLPANWQQVRDRWVRFHVIRVVAGLASLVLLLNRSDLLINGLDGGGDAKL